MSQLTTRINRGQWRLLLIFSAMLLVWATIYAVFLPRQASAAQITGRKVTLSSSAGGATGVSYTFVSAALPTTTAVKSVSIDACTAASGTCTTPSGFSSSSSTLASQPTGLGSTTSWSVNTATSGSLRITHASNSTASSGAVSIQWNGVVNPTAQNTTFFLRATTYSDSAWATPLDTGVMGVSTAQQITVSGTLDETLTFCAGTSITGTNCGTIAGTTVSLGAFSTSAANTGTSVMAASTNATTGYAITVNGTTLTSGSNTITALAAQAASSTGTSQFGLNLRSNTSPATVGADPSGGGSGSYTANYGTTNQYRFVTGDSVASAAGATNANAFTVTYLANVPGSQAPGTYTAVMTYICTATY
jgi:hypothetical protein